MNTYTIYAIVLNSTDDAYVGRTTNVRARFADHRSRLKKGNHGNLDLQTAWNLYGSSSFDFTVLEGGVSEDQCVAAEARHVDQRGSFNLMRPLSDHSAFTHGPSSRLAMGKTIKAWYAAGSEASDAQREVLRVAQLAYIQSPEGREMARQNATRRWQDPVEAAKMRTGFAKSISDPAIIAKRNAAISAAHNQPETKANHVATMKSFWADPERSAAVREKRKNSWTPERKAARSAQGKAMYAARRAAKP